MKIEFLIRKLNSLIPLTEWLPKYKSDFLKWDVLAGITLAFFVLPESMAYATLAGVPAYFGIYSCIAASFFFAFFTTSKHVAVGPTSAISLMIGSTAAILSGGDPIRWAQIAALAALVVAAFSLIAFVFKLSSLVSFISDSILMGFKAGAALTIISTQLPKLFGVEGGGKNFFERIVTLFQHIPETNWVAFCFGSVALILFFSGDKIFPKIPISLFIVIASIVILSVTNLSSFGIHIIGEFPGGLPSIKRPSLRFTDVDGILELSFACFLIGYIETISAARTIATKNNYTINARQELLSLSMANLAAAFSSGYAVSGGLSQSTVNEKSGAKTPLSLIICSLALVIILLYFTGLLKNLPEVILAVIVIHAVSGLIKIKELKRIRQLSKPEFTVAMIALSGVLIFGILKGVMLAVVMSLILLIRRTANPNVAVLGRIGNTDIYSDIERHIDNILAHGVLIMRIESSIIYFNFEDIQEKIQYHINAYKGTLKLVVLDLSASPFVDIAGSKMLVQLSDDLNKKGIRLKIVEALSNVRDLLRKQQMEEVIGKISRRVSINDVIQEFKNE